MQQIPNFGFLVGLLGLSLSWYHRTASQCSHLHVGFPTFHIWLSSFGERLLLMDGSVLLCWFIVATIVEQNQDNIRTNKKKVKKITCSSIKIISILISSSVALLIESQTLITFTLMLHNCPLVVRSLKFW